VTRDPDHIAWTPTSIGWTADLGAGAIATVTRDAVGWWWQVAWPARLVPANPSVELSGRVRSREPRSRSGHADTEADAMRAAEDAGATGRP
jgi:hypothetical protein